MPLIWARIVARSGSRAADWRWPAPRRPCRAPRPATGSRRGRAPNCRRAGRSGRAAAAARKLRGEPVEQGGRVERPVIAGLAVIDDQRAAAGDVEPAPRRPRPGCAARAPPAEAITGTRQRSGCASGSSRLNWPWRSATWVWPPLQRALSTRISGTPGCSVKSWAMAVTGLPAACSIARQRSSVCGVAEPVAGGYRRARRSATHPRRHNPRAW